MAADLCRRILAGALASTMATTAVLLSLASPASAAVASRRFRAYEWATDHAGCPYVWGGTGPCAFDCSGLVVASYGHEGIGLPRTTFEMLGSSRLKRVRHRNTHVGELAFYGSGHVELVAGRHWTFGAPEPGENVGWHHWTWDGYHPTGFYKVRDAG